MRRSLSKSPKKRGARALTVGLACLLCRAQTLETVAIAPPPEAASYKLVFSDDFNSLDTLTNGSGNDTWHEGVWFNHVHAPLANICVADSVLSLTWRANQGSAETSISTFSRHGSEAHAWRHGYFEARMKWDVVKGAWPAFWLIPVQDAEGRSTHKGVRESGEIDVFEGQGDQPRTYFGTIHDWINLKDRSNADNHFALPDGFDFSRFHTYGLLWQPGKVTWYLDGRALHSENTPAIFDMQTFFMVLSMREGANWTAGDRSGVISPEMALQVDWVRIWQK